MPYKRKYRKRKKYKKRGVTNSMIKEIKRIDTQQLFKRSPMLRAEKTYPSALSPTTQFLDTQAIFQCPYQDIPLQVGTVPSMNQRLGTELFPQVLKFNGVLSRQTGNTDIQRFRIMVIRYNGESDFQVDNSSTNGWQAFSDEWAHTCRPGEVWSVKPYIKNQIKVLYDKTYVLNDSNKSGIVANFTLPIKRKMTFETATSGTAAVGAGNITIMITSDRSYMLSNYRTYAFYKDLQ